MSALCVKEEPAKKRWFGRRRLPEAVVLPFDLEAALRESLTDLRHNQMLFDLETEPELIDATIYERKAILCHYAFLLRCARQHGLAGIVR